MKTWSSQLSVSFPWNFSKRIKNCHFFQRPALIFYLNILEFKIWMTQTTAKSLTGVNWRSPGRICLIKNSLTPEKLCKQLSCMTNTGSRKSKGSPEMSVSLFNFNILTKKKKKKNLFLNFSKGDRNLWRRPTIKKKIHSGLAIWILHNSSLVIVFSSHKNGSLLIPFNQFRDVACFFGERWLPETCMAFLLGWQGSIPNFKISLLLSQIKKKSKQNSEPSL